MERRIIAPPWPTRSGTGAPSRSSAAISRGSTSCSPPWCAASGRPSNAASPKAWRCAARADANDVSPSDVALDEAATAYRYDRDLISAADVTAWLDRVGLSADEWIDYLRRDLLRQQWSGELDDLLDRFTPSARDLVETAVIDGISRVAREVHRAPARRRAAAAGHRLQVGVVVVVHRQFLSARDRTVAVIPDAVVDDARADVWLA